MCIRTVGKLSSNKIEWNRATGSNVDEFFKPMLSERNKIGKTSYTMILYIKLDVDKTNLFC